MNEDIGRDVELLEARGPPGESGGEFLMPAPNMPFLEGGPPPKSLGLARRSALENRLVVGRIALFFCCFWSLFALGTFGRNRAGAGR